jgi:hypothetical protein
MHYQKTKPDSLALRWLLHIRKFHELDSLEHPSFVQLTVHCLVADGSLDANRYCAPTPYSAQLQQIEMYLYGQDAFPSTPSNRSRTGLKPL